MSTIIKYNSIEVGSSPLTNNPNCECVLFIYATNIKALSLKKATDISYNNLSIRSYLSAFNIPVKLIVTTSGDYIYYFLVGDVIDVDLSLIDSIPSATSVSFEVGSISATLPYTITSLDIGNGVNLSVDGYYNNSLPFYGWSIAMFTNNFSTNWGAYVFEPEYVTILEKVNNANQPLFNNNYVFKNHNIFIKNLKAAGIWNKLDVLYVFALGSAGADPIYDYFRTLNWKNPDLYQATLVNSFLRGTQGIQRNGASLSYVDTNFVPSIHGVNYTLNDASRYTYRQAVSGSGAIDGTATSNNNNLSTSGGSNQNRINSTNTHSSSVATTAQAVSINRLSSTSVKISNDATISSRTQTSTALPSESQLILRNGGSYGAHRMSVYAMGAALSDAEIIAFNNAVQALLIGI